MEHTYTYYIYLPFTKEYIMETVEEHIWLKTMNKGECYTNYNIHRVTDIAKQICKDKHLIINDDIIVCGEYEITYIDTFNV